MTDKKVDFYCSHTELESFILMLERTNTHFKREEYGDGEVYITVKGSLTDEEVAFCFSSEKGEQLTEVI